MQTVYIDEVTSRAAIFPWSADEASRLRLPKYTDRNGCIHCNLTMTTRYVDDGSCVGCLQRALSEALPLWLMGHPDRPTPWILTKEDALKAGNPWYYHNPKGSLLCDNGPHLRKACVISGRCFECASKRQARESTDGRSTASTEYARMNPDAIMSREVAKALGFALYRTGEPCRRGHTGWRYVSTGNCLDCLRKR